MDGWGKIDQRYKKTEEKILAVFFSEPECTMRQLAKKAGIARSTIYMHHHSHKQIILDYEKIILENYCARIQRKLLEEDIHLKNFYLDMLLFIAKNRKVFEVFLKFDCKRVLIKMLSNLQVKIREPERVFRVYMTEVSEVIFEWGERGFSEGEIEKVLSDIMQLTRTIHERLLVFYKH